MPHRVDSIRRCTNVKSFNRVSATRAHIPCSDAEASHATSQLVDGLKSFILAQTIILPTPTSSSPM